VGTIALVLSLTLVQSGTNQPDTSTNPGAAQATYRSIKDAILRSAAKMPAEHFDFRPTPEVRSFDLILAHITDGNYLLCAPAAGEPSPNGAVVDKTERDRLAREPLVARLRDSFAMCDRAYARLTDANGDDVLPFMNMKRPRLGLLWFHISHAFEHYGNLVTYMRLKGIVPPTSETP
jgi:uncharacterized damage-inducible protein DinB